MEFSPTETRASLIVRLRDAADVVAWDTMVAVYGPVVFRVAHLQGFQPADADNLVQEVLLSVSRSVSNWLEREDRGSFRAWLLRIARNRAVNMLTRRSTRPFAMDGEDADRLLDEMPAHESELSLTFDLEYRREVFRWAADQVRRSVAESTWQAFWLTHIEGFEIPQAAEQLGVNVGNIYFGRSRVMSRLRDLVKQFEVEQ